MFGRVGVLPHDFYCMEIEDAALMYKGWADEKYDNMLLVRRSTLIIAKSMTKIDENRVWPIEKKKKEKSGLVGKLEKLTVAWRAKDLVDKHKKLGLGKR